MLVKDLVPLFLGWCARHRAAATCRFYSQRLKAFVEQLGDRPFCAPVDPEHPEAGISSLQLDEYLAAAGEGQSDSTRRHNAVALSTLQAFAIREKLLKPDRKLFDRLEKPRMGRREHVPTPEDVGRLLEKAPPEFSLIYRALSQCGARPGEFCRLTVDQIDWTRKRIDIQQHKTARKTGRPRTIPIGSKLEPLLREAIASRTEGPVFLDRQGKPWTVGKLSGMHTRLRKGAGLDKAIVLYSARHRFATELLRNGVGIKDVADLLGHASVTMTERYVHRDAGELGDVQDRVG